MTSLIWQSTKLNFFLAFTAVLLYGAAAIAQPVPVAHWTFDEGINNYDLTSVTDGANGNTGQWQNVVDGSPVGLSYTVGQIGGAASFGGAPGQYFEVTEIPQLDGITPAGVFPNPAEAGVGITISAWINLSSDAGSNQYDGIVTTRTLDESVDADQNWGIAWEETGGNSHIDARFSGVPIDSSAGADPDSILPDTWHHVVLVWGNIDGADASFDPLDAATTGLSRLYLDGVEVGDLPAAGIDSIVDSGTWFLGFDDCCGGGRAFDGLLDDIAIFGEALTTAEIQTLRSNALSGIDASGTNTGQLQPGDVDGLDGLATIADFNIIRDALGTEATGRNQGDLNGDRMVDLDDFQQWLENASPAVGAQALAILSGASVPEPTGAALAGLSLAFVGLVRRSNKR